MADIVNLRRARKEKARRQCQTEAETNRRRFGRTREQRRADEDAERRAERSHDSKRLVPDRDEP